MTSTRRTHPVVDELTEQIARDSQRLAAESMAPGPNADVSDHEIKALRERIARLRAIRVEVEDLMSQTMHPGF